MTIESKKVIKDLILGGGFFSEGRQIYAVYSYINGITLTLNYAVFCRIEHIDVYESPFVLFPILLWSAKKGTTKEGEDWLIDQIDKKEGE